MPVSPANELSASASNAVLDQLAEGVIIADVEGRIRFVNEAARVMHGVDAIDVEPSEYSSTYHLFTVEGEPYPFDALPLARAVAGETVLDEAWLIRRPDGTEVYAVGSAKPLLGPQDEQIGAVLTLRDETERRAAELQLSESEETVRAFFETTGIYTAVIDLDADDFHLAMGNRRMATVFGQDRLEGQSGRALVGDAQAMEILRLFRGATESTEPQIVEYPWDLAGERRWFVATINVMPQGRTG